MKQTRFLALREEIRKKRQSSQEQWSYEIGKWREEKMTSLLQELKKGKFIHDFLKTDDLSFQDIVEGIDFFIVYVDNAYKFYPLSVTGKKWIKEHKRRHPEIPVIDVAESDTAVSMRGKIMKAINQNKGSL